MQKARVCSSQQPAQQVSVSFLVMQFFSLIWAHASSKFFPLPAPAMQAILAMPSAFLCFFHLQQPPGYINCIIRWFLCYVFTDETVHLDYETLLGSNNIHIALYLSFLLREENWVNFTFCSVSCLLLERLPLRSTLYLEMMKKLIGR